MNRTMPIALCVLLVGALTMSCGAADGPGTVDVPEVHVTFTKTADGCEITYTPDSPITLHKNPDNGPNQAVWTWSGDGYERAWVIFEQTDLQTCLNGHLIKGSVKGFEIVMPGGTTKTVNPAVGCRRGSYDYALRAVSGDGDECGADPGVIIEN